VRAVVVCQEVELSRAGAEAGVVTEAWAVAARAVARAAEASAVARAAEARAVARAVAARAVAARAEEARAAVAVEAGTMGLPGLAGNAK